MEAVTAIIYNIIHGTFKVKREIVDEVRSSRNHLCKIVDKKIARIKRKELMIRRSNELVILIRVAVKEIFARNVS